MLVQLLKSVFFINPVYNQRNYRDKHSHAQRNDEGGRGGVGNALTDNGYCDYAGQIAEHTSDHIFCGVYSRRAEKHTYQIHR